MKELIQILFILPLLIFQSSLYSQSGWVQINSSTNNHLNSVFFINENTGFVTGLGGVILKTTNAGLSWQRTFDNTNIGVNSIFMINENLGYAVGFFGVYGRAMKTTDGGGNWSNLLMPYNTRGLNSVYFINSDTGFVAGGTSIGNYSYPAIFRTTNGGYNWTYNMGGMDQTFYSVYFMSSIGYVVGGSVIQGRVLKTSNLGDNWNSINLSYSYVLYSVNFHDNIGFTCDLSGKVFKTTDYGISWNHVILSNNALASVFFTNNIGYCVGANGKIFKTFNDGNNWYLQFSPSNNKLNSVFMLNSNTGYICGDNGTVLKTNDGGGPVGIRPIFNEIPYNLNLYQNYPNPFNPSTKIKFDLPKSSFTKLIVYDVLGKILSIPVNEMLKPGSYEVEFDGSNYPTGVYFYKLISEDFMDTKKMVLIK